MNAVDQVASYADTDSRDRAANISPLRSAKIHNEHLQKLAIVYVRQSSPQQVVENRESRERQYALADFAQALGWPAERVLVIDDDQGQSGTRADNRDGFQQMLAEVTMDHAGIVLGLEMSRLARSSKDWHHLLEVCGIFDTLLADQDGVYNASDPNDRLLLGLKGTMSEVELQTMRNRLQRGAMNKAKRGELFHRVPFGYVILPNGQLALDPDEQARLVVQLKMSHMKLRDWAHRGWLHARKTPIQGYWIVWADGDEVARLRELLAKSQRGKNYYTPELTTPKPRT